VASFDVTYGLDLSSWDDLLSVTALPFDADVPNQIQDRNALLEAIADRYYGAVKAALDVAIPNHLNLCDRIAEVAPLPVFRMAGKYCDVVSVNDYYIQSDPLIDLLLGAPPDKRWAQQSAAAFQGAGGPIPFVVTEYGIRGEDSGLPNTYGAGKTVPTQQDRAMFYLWSSRWFLHRVQDDMAYITGWHWFMYTDEPPTGRSFDPEDCNYGIVTLRNEAYVFLLQAMTQVNQMVDDILAADTTPTILEPPGTIDTSVTSPGLVTLTWPSDPPVASDSDVAPSPGAEGWRVHVLTHPAGTDTRIVGFQDVASANATVDLASFGDGLFWLAVEPLSTTLLHLGARVVGPFEGVAAGGGVQTEVLNCETLAGVRFHNSLPLPNTAAGQTYATLEDSFVEGGVRH